MKQDLALAFEKISRAIAITTMSFGLAVVFGWILDISALKSVLPGLVTMKFNTALAFILTGVSFYLAAVFPDKQALIRISRALLGLVVAIGVITLAEYIFNIDLGIDQFFFRESAGAVLTVHLGRMALFTALNFILFPLAILSLDLKFGNNQYLAQYLALLGGILAYFSLIGYLFGVKIFLVLDIQFTAMALHTAVLFFGLALAVFMARPKHGIMTVFTSDTLPGLFLRRFVPLACILPPFFGWLKLVGERSGTISNELGVALVALCNSTVIVFLVSATIREADNIDLRRKQAEEKLYILNRTLEQQVAERTAQLEATNKELETFSYSISHDLSAPLRVMDGFSQAVLEDYAEKLEPVGKDYLKRIRQGAQRMSLYITDILNLSRISSKDIVKQEVELSILAQEIAAELKKGEKKRQISFQIKAGLKVQSDPVLMRSLLLNLLGNAVKFTGKKPQARIEFGVVKKAGDQVFFIRDNGVGFSMKFKDKLFRAFQRLHSSEQFPGTGIGLATVQRIINRLNGRVWAEGQPGKGAVFYFKI